MRILFDQGTPVPLRRFMHPHQIDTCAECGWSCLENGELLAEAASAGYEAFVTTDQKLKYQQNLKNRTLRILVLKTTSWPKIRRKADFIREVIEELSEGTYREIDI